MMTSTRCRNLSGTVRPMAFAVLRLMASSNFVGCSIGMSFGCLPCRILCTNLAPCRKAAGPSAPNDINPPISANARVVDAVGKRYLMAISVTGLTAKLPWTTTTSARSCTIVVVTDGETKPGAFSCGFRGEEGIENLLFHFGWNTRAVVANPDFHAIAMAFG